MVILHRPIIICPGAPRMEATDRAKEELPWLQLMRIRLVVGAASPIRPTTAPIVHAAAARRLPPTQ